ncbi:hypothetical protein M3Y97_00699300 [Aphelenchoides bicaudatus]|nr:hypothetical protein M3Y97_00699300 [Aphelenchoides bicaudatus]
MQFYKQYEKSKTSEYKNEKFTVAEQNRQPEPSRRTKKRNELALIQIDLQEKKFCVIQEKTAHMSKMGIREGRNHLLMLEEVIYLMELGAAAVVTDPNSSEFLSLNQLYSMLPLFNISLFQFCAFRSLLKANYRVRKAYAEHQDLFHYNVYVSEIKNVTFNEQLRDNFLKFYLFAGKPNEEPSDALKKFAQSTTVPVLLASGQPSCVRYALLLAPIKADFSAIQLSQVDTDS